MARNIVMGLVESGYESKQICVTNRSPEKLAFFKEECGVRTTQNNLEGAKEADVIVLSVKPKQLQSVCEELKAIIQKNHLLVISLATGITTASIQKWLGDKVAVIRAMPNTPSAVHAGVTGLFASLNTNQSERGLAESILRAVGIVVWLQKEDQVDLIAALSGSGPAYIFLFMEAMQDAAKQLGIPEENIGLLTAQTVLGAARMALESNEDIIALRRSVTSPNGSTEQAIKVFESGNIRDVVLKALIAAVNRSREIGKEFN